MLNLVFIGCFFSIFVFYFEKFLYICTKNLMHGTAQSH